VIDTSTPFSVFDFGCGYGALLDHMEETYPEFKYTGFDICEEMVVNAIESHKGKTNVAWHTQQPENELFDYTIASGIFNVRQDHSDDEWKKYIEDTIMDMNRYSRKGFAFNVLTSYSDVEKRQDYLYYADPLYFFDFCKKNCSKYVTLNHSYPLWEFSILVTKA
jgi:SAM-dependent methyltransferase